MGYPTPPMAKDRVAARSASMIAHVGIAVPPPRQPAGATGAVLPHPVVAAERNVARPVRIVAAAGVAHDHVLVDDPRRLLRRLGRRLHGGGADGALRVRGRWPLGGPGGRC